MSVVTLDNEYEHIKVAPGGGKVQLWYWNEAEHGSTRRIRLTPAQARKVGESLVDYAEGYEAVR